MSATGTRVKISIGEELQADELARYYNVAILEGELRGQHGVLVITTQNTATGRPPEISLTPIGEHDNDR